MGLFTRHDLDAATAAALSDYLGVVPRVLSWALTQDGVAAGLSDRLVYRREGRWVQQAWHEVERGGWDQQAGDLRWVDHQGREESLHLVEPRRLPELFNERVTASIVLQKVVELGRGRTAVVSLRRDLGSPASPMVWRVQLGARVRPDDPEVESALNTELERLRSEYDFA